MLTVDRPRDYIARGLEASDWVGQYPVPATDGFRSN